MIIETTDTILAQLRTIDGLKTIDDWHGEIDDLVKQATRLPGVWLVYTGGTFRPKEVTGTTQAKQKQVMDLAVVVIDKNLRGKDAAAPGCYQIIEQVRNKLIGFKVGRGFMWPTTEQMIHSEKGKLAYALEYWTEQTFTP